MFQETITKFNPKFYNYDFSAEENFVNQLQEVLNRDYENEELNEYLQLQLEHLKTLCESAYARMFLIDFQQERNHPDEDVYDDRNNPCREYCESLEEQIKEVEMQIKQLEDDFDKKCKEMKVA